MTDYIRETVTAENAIYIRTVNPHSWNQLRALKERLGPTDAARTMAIEVKYRELC